MLPPGGFARAACVVLTQGPALPEGLCRVSLASSGRDLGREHEGTPGTLAAAQTPTSPWAPQGRPATVSRKRKASCDSAVHTGLMTEGKSEKSGEGVRRERCSSQKQPTGFPRARAHGQRPGGHSFRNCHASLGPSHGRGRRGRAAAASSGVKMLGGGSVLIRGGAASCSTRSFPGPCRAARFSKLVLD